MKKFKFKKGQKENLFFGIFFTAWGIYLLLGEGDFYRFRGINVSRTLIGIASIFLGCFALLMAALKRPGPSDQEYVICIKCKHPYYKKDTKNSICPVCGGPLENMDGIYERYPEFKNKSEST